MTDSSVRDRLDAKHEGDQERRIAAIKRWVAYIESEPAEIWGPQQNAIVDDQLDAAQDASTSAAHQQRVRDVAAAIIEDRDSNDRQE
ncbi:hypothetical protein [Halococcus agarilyticus]|uniref:hypothetical protein n=1 Tax=Halococcus agarilyticus TaxID=1232219 RepID=UPI000677EB03|nr:hypothetical protein [Halococcus agarilyticus]